MDPNVKGTEKHARSEASRELMCLCLCGVRGVCAWCGTGGVEHITTNGVIGYKADGRLSHFSALQFPSPPLPAAAAGAAEARGTSSNESPLASSARTLLRWLLVLLLRPLAART